MKITAHIEFDSAAEAAAFFGRTNGLTFSDTITGSTPSAAEEIVPDNAGTLPDAAAPAPGGQTPAQAAIADALAASAADKAKVKGDGPKGRAKKSEAAAPEPTAAPSPAPTEAPAAAPGAPAEKPVEPANDQPTATAAPETGASSESDQGFFGFTSQDANATDASTSERVFTHKQVHDALFAWSKLTERATFAALMARCEVATVNDLAGKPELYPTIIKTIEDNIAKNGKGTKVEIVGDTIAIV